MWRMTEYLSGDELRGANATLVWDGLGAVQLRYGGGWLRQQSTLSHQLLKRLGERTVPVEALKDVELVMPGGTEDPMIRLVLRDGADPLTTVAGGDLAGLFDPYRFYFKNEQWLLADYYAQEIRTSIALHQVSAEPAAGWLVAAPDAEDELKGFDGKAKLIGDQLVFDWGWTAPKEKKSARDPRSVPVADVRAVEWRPMEGKNLGFVRVTTSASPAERPDPAKDPEALLLGATHQVPGLLFAARLLSQVSPG
jgi:hypothetical protein